jgi:2-amino-4-hydroxy-6-hydroxymethyldihydropteridine diphosphokinase
MSGSAAQSHTTPAAAAVRAYVGVGSNLDDPLQQVIRALAALEGLPATRCAARSSLYRSRPLGEVAQPDFINAVVLLETRLAAHDLLRALQRIEADQGRARRADEHWGPRTLDLDLLLYGTEHIDDPQLTVPHPELSRRDFVLYPMSEIDPDLVIPGLGSLRECLQRCPWRGLQRVEGRDESAAS